MHYGGSEEVVAEEEGTGLWWKNLATINCILLGCSSVNSVRGQD